MRARALLAPVLAAVVASGATAMAVTTRDNAATDVVSASARLSERSRAATPPSQSPAAEGIVMHGRWHITIRDSDGAIVQDRAFENGIANGGRQLVRFLTRQDTPGPWRIVVWGAGTEQLCPHTNLSNPFAPGGSCVMAESFKANDWTLMGSPTAENGETAIVLRGSFAPVAGGSIANVGTWMAICNNMTTPSACPSSATMANGMHRITSKSLDTPIRVEAGQQVQITVRLSFSSPAASPPA